MFDAQLRPDSRLRGNDGFQCLMHVSNQAILAIFLQWVPQQAAQNTANHCLGSVQCRTVLNPAWLSKAVMLSSVYL